MSLPIERVQVSQTSPWNWSHICGKSSTLYLWHLLSIYVQDINKATVTLADGTSLSGDLLIGADGERVSTPFPSQTCTEKLIIKPVDHKSSLQRPNHVTPSTISHFPRHRTNGNSFQWWEAVVYVVEDNRKICYFYEGEEEFELVWGEGVSFFVEKVAKT